MTGKTPETSRTQSFFKKKNRNIVHIQYYVSYRYTIY